MIAVKCCKWYDNCAVVAAYAKCCSVMIPNDGVPLIPIFHRIWITMESFFVKWPLLYEYWFIFPGYLCNCSIEKHVTFPTLVKVRRHSFIHLQNRGSIYCTSLQCLFVSKYTIIVIWTVVRVLSIQFTDFFTKFQYIRIVKSIIK